MTGELIWRSLPGLSKYAISNTGVVRNKSTNRVLALKRKVVKTDFYYDVGLSNDENINNTYRVHRLVCRAFHGEPPSDNLVVNHKDGNKINNHESNLEWVTQKRNVEHAFELGLNPKVHGVSMYDLVTNETHTFINLKAMEVRFGLKPSGGIRIVSKYQKIPYLDRYIFTIDETKIRDCSFGEIGGYCIDFKTGILHRFENLTQLQVNVGLNRATMRELVVEHKVRLINGCVVCKLENLDELFTFIEGLTQKQIDDSVARMEKYHTYDREWNRFEWLIKNYLTGEIVKVGSTKEVFEHEVFRDVKQGMTQAELKLFKGHSVKRDDPTVEFKDYSQAYIELSLEYDVNGRRPIIVTDLSYNTVRAWPSISSFVNSTGLKPKNHLKLAEAKAKFKRTHRLDYMQITN